MMKRIVFLCWASDSRRMTFLTANIAKKFLTTIGFPKNLFVCEKKLYICIEKAKG